MNSSPTVVTEYGYEHIYSRIARVVTLKLRIAGKGSWCDTAPATVEKACTESKEHGIVITTYADPERVADMLIKCGYLG